MRNQINKTTNIYMCVYEYMYVYGTDLIAKNLWLQFVVVLVVFYVGVCVCVCELTNRFFGQFLNYAFFL